MNAKPLLFLSLLAFTAHADVYKCQIDGKTVYQDSPGASCQSAGIDTSGPTPYQQAMIDIERAKNTREYQQSMAGYEQGWIAEGQARADAINATAARMNIQADITRADTRRILDDIGVVHPPVYGTPWFPLPVTVTNPQYRH